MILSLRKKGDSVYRFGAPTWHSEFLTDPPLPPPEVQRRLAGKRVCALIHGYNVNDALDAYARIAQLMTGAYDYFIDSLWPGSNLKLGFWFARKRAEKAGRLLAQQLAFIDPELLDIQGHSLGCRVALEALKEGLHCHNLILSAAAVDDEEICEGERYGDAVLRAQTVLVAHSERDSVLKRAYRMALWDRALGLTGPEPGKTLAPHVRVVDLTPWVGEHGGYKKSSEYYRRWKEVADWATD